MAMNTDKIEAFIKKYNMIPADGRILCAVSGGADSVCLLHYLAATRPGQVVCAHFDHQLRGEESQRDARFVEELAKKFGIQFILGSGDVRERSGQNGKGIEETAREMRYEFLQNAAREYGCAVIATAHNAEDNAETVIMNIARGTGLKGLCGIPPVRGNVVRPILCLTRAEVEEYLRENGLEHIEDSTNVLDDYARNRVRHHVLPVLREQNTAFADNILAMTQLVREDEEYLSGLAGEFLEENLCDNSLQISKLNRLPKPIRVRIFRAICPGADSTHIAALEKMCFSEKVHAFSDLPGMRVERERDTLIFGAGDCEPIAERQLLPESEVYIEEIGKTVFCRRAKKDEEINNSFNTFCFKCASICGKMTVASKTDGAQIRLCGRGCTKSLKKLFAERGMTLTQRAQTPVIYDEKGPVAVMGFGIAERCAAQQGDDIYIVEIK